MNDFNYVGSELELFAAALNWKTYWSRQVAPFVAGDVLEVGAGMGSNTPVLDPGGTGRWVCLEPDRQLSDQSATALGRLRTGRTYESVCGTLDALGSQLFDTIIYIDVLEHIEDDRDELNRAASRLRPGGHLIVLSPAHESLYSPFDAAIGHFRRYSRSALLNKAPGTLRPVRVRHLDSAGLILSAANRLVLRQSMPTKEQLRFWDSWIVPVSRVLDGLLLYRLGKSIVAIWHKDSST